MPNVPPSERLRNPGWVPSEGVPRGEPLIVALRHATAERHAAVERLPLMRALMAPTVTCGDYRLYIGRMAQVYGTLEPPLRADLEEGLAGHPDLGPDLRSALSPKLPALLADLAALGLSPRSITVSRRRGDLSRALRGLHVLEGATLGSRVIARHLRRHLGDEGAGDPLGSAAFMGLHDDPQGPSASRAWRQFGDGLDTLAELDLIAPDRVVESAQGVFERVHQILAGPRAPI
jgi:heme oxygenase (biliverdin-IX-beta and delta-forming)